MGVYLGPRLRFINWQTNDRYLMFNFLSHVYGNYFNDYNDLLGRFEVLRPIVIFKLSSSKKTNLMIINTKFIGDNNLRYKLRSFQGRGIGDKSLELRLGLTVGKTYVYPTTEGEYPTDMLCDVNYNNPAVPETNYMGVYQEINEESITEIPYFLSCKPGSGEHAHTRYAYDYRFGDEPIYTYLSDIPAEVAKYKNIADTPRLIKTLKFDKDAYYLKYGRRYIGLEKDTYLHDNDFYIIDEENSVNAYNSMSVEAVNRYYNIAKTIVSQKYNPLNIYFDSNDVLTANASCNLILSLNTVPCTLHPSTLLYTIT